MKFNMNIYFDVISKYTFDVIQKSGFQFRNSPLWPVFTTHFTNTLAAAALLTGKFPREIISRTFCNFFFLILNCLDLYVRVNILNFYDFFSLRK